MSCVHWYINCINSLKVWTIYSYAGSANLWKGSHQRGQFTLKCHWPSWLQINTTSSMQVNYTTAVLIIWCIGILKSVDLFVTSWSSAHLLCYQKVFDSKELLTMFVCDDTFKTPPSGSVAPGPWWPFPEILLPPHSCHWMHTPLKTSLYLMMLLETEILTQFFEDLPAEQTWLYYILWSFSELIHTPSPVKIGLQFCKNPPCSQKPFLPHCYAFHHEISSQPLDCTVAEKVSQKYEIIFSLFVIFQLS